ncbi:MAG: hypothetical protein PHY46_05845 [Candidatus Omnitrophica bacterium]|nr:hypothetical protein [Candidatus Omnitrophota bacterium]MDD5355831.1 hypothetical protein [Candidatus Omnitrophota bacterium]
MFSRRQYHLDIGKISGVLFIAIYIFIVVTFFLSQLVVSSQKPLWGDEKNGLQSSIINHSYVDILINGAKLQGSPSPLDYLACKFLYRIKEKVSYFGLAQETYFRLFANFITAFSMLMIMFLFKKEISLSKDSTAVKTIQLFMLLCLPLVFLFNWKVYYYAAEMRPYALWNSLFMIVLAVSLLDAKNNKLFIAMLIPLSLSATAVIFQLGAIILAYFIVGFMQKEDSKDLFNKAIRLFAIPFLLVFYYCLRVGKMSFEGGDWGDFLEFWIRKSDIILMMAVSIALCLIKKENTKYAIAPLAFLILFIMGPIEFWVTKLRGFFFADRQFIYYELAKPLFLLTAIKCMPAYARGAKSKFAFISVILFFCFIGCVFMFNSKRLTKFHNAAADALRIVGINFKETMPPNFIIQQDE